MKLERFFNNDDKLKLEALVKELLKTSITETISLYFEEDENSKSNKGGENVA